MIGTIPLQGRQVLKAMLLNGPVILTGADHPGVPCAPQVRAVIASRLYHVEVLAQVVWRSSEDEAEPDFKRQTGTLAWPEP